MPINNVRKFPEPRRSSFYFHGGINKSSLLLPPREREIYILIRFVGICFLDRESNETYIGKCE